MDGKIVVGVLDGPEEGSAVGTTVDGALVGPLLGSTDGCVVGCEDGTLVGKREIDGIDVDGTNEGELDGTIEG